MVYIFIFTYYYLLLVKNLKKIKRVVFNVTRCGVDIVYKLLDEILDI